MLCAPHYSGLNAAGVVGAAPFPIDELPYPEWQRMMAVNNDGGRCGHSCDEKNRRGAIANIGSTTSFVSIVDAIPYNDSKASVRALTRNAAFGAGKLGYKVRVNVVHPTWIWTPLDEAILLKKYGSREKVLEVILQQHCVGRLPEPSDIATAVVFLASHEAELNTGADLVIDGGRFLG